MAIIQEGVDEAAGASPMELVVCVRAASTNVPAGYAVIGSTEEFLAEIARASAVANANRLFGAIALWEGVKWHVHGYMIEGTQLLVTDDPICWNLQGWSEDGQSFFWTEIQVLQLTLRSVAEARRAGQSVAFCGVVEEELRPSASFKGWG